MAAAIFLSDSSGVTWLPQLFRRWLAPDHCWQWLQVSHRRLFALSPRNSTELLNFEKSGARRGV